MVLVGDFSVCALHDYDGCFEARLSVQQYWNLVTQYPIETIRFICWLFTATG